MHVIGLCVILYSALGSSQNINGEVQSDKILKECNKMPKGKFRRACMFISRDPVLVEYDRNISVSTSEETKSDGSDSAARTFIVLGETDSEARTIQIKQQCNTFNILDKSLPDNLRSLSPWKFKITYNASRFPQQLAEAKCLCDYCINPYTLKEDKQLKAKLVTKKTLVMQKIKEDGLPFTNCSKKTCKNVHIDTGVACHCLPVTIEDP